MVLYSTTQRARTTTTTETTFELMGYLRKVKLVTYQINICDNFVVARIIQENRGKLTSFRINCIIYTLLMEILHNMLLLKQTKHRKYLFYNMPH